MADFCGVRGGKEDTLIILRYDGQIVVNVPCRRGNFISKGFSYGGEVSTELFSDV